MVKGLSSSSSSFFQDNNFKGGNGTQITILHRTDSKGSHHAPRSNQNTLCNDDDNDDNVDADVNVDTI